MALAKSEVVIYHNPACTTSRKVLGMIRDAGTEPHVIEYLKTPPTRPELVDLLRRMGIRPRELLRRRGVVVVRHQPWNDLFLGHRSPIREIGAAQFPHVEPALLPIIERLILQVRLVL